MKYNRILFPSVFLAGLVAGAVTQAADTVVNTETTTRVTRPLAIVGDTQEVKPAIQRFVERVNQARVSLAKADTKEALFDINEAEKHMQFIKNNSNYKEVTRQTVISSGQVVYDTQATAYNSYYVPLEEGPVLIKEYASTENQQGKGQKNAIAVKSAKVVYLNVDLSGDDVETSLKQARNMISEGNLSGADDELAKMLDKIIVADSVQQKPEIVARDNLQLALGFLEEENFVASRFALAQAEDALQSLQKTGTFDAKKVDDIHSDVKKLQDLTMQENSNAAEKARAQIKAVQIKLDKLS